MEKSKQMTNNKSLSYMETVRLMAMKQIKDYNNCKQWNVSK